MRKLFEAFRSIFSTPDLRNRVLFTLGLLGVSPRCVYTDSWDQHRPSSAAFRAKPGISTGDYRSVQRRKFPQADDFCVRHYAVHHGINHSPVAGCGMALLCQRLQKEGELGRGRSHAIYALSHNYPERFSIVYDCADAHPSESGRTGSGIYPRGEIHSMTMLTLTTGSAFIMWLGEQITTAASATACR